MNFDCESSIPVCPFSGEFGGLSHTLQVPADQNLCSGGYALVDRGQSGIQIAQCNEDGAPGAV